MKQDLQQFANLVYTYCGLDYRTNLSTIEYKMAARLTQLEMHSFTSYMKYVNEHEGEWVQIVERLTINETYFNREDKQFEVLIQLMQSDEKLLKQESLNIWSAACSSGEEPYSIAMNLADANMPLSHVKILGTDINEKVLHHASNGKYATRSLSFRRIPKHWLSNYFTLNADHYEVKEAIKQNVSFEKTNLIELENEYMEQMDIIYCRNVLIYFDEATIEKVVRMFYKSLKKGGYLFLGHAETISKFQIGFETLNSNGTFYYRKA